MGADDDTKQAQFKLGEWIAKIAVSLVSAAAIAAFGLGWQLDRAVLSHDAQLNQLADQLATMRRQRRCDPHDDPHPMCARLDRIEATIRRYHKE